MTREQAVELKIGAIIHETNGFNKDGTCRRWRVNGIPRAFKRVPENFRVPIKHGIYAYGYLTKWNVMDMHLESECENTTAGGK